MLLLEPNKGGCLAGNSLVIRAEASYTLNFLVYLQNIFLNQNNYEPEYRFPYLPSKHFAFEDNFEIHFKELWDQMAQRLADDCLVDLKIFHDEKERFYLKLFVDSDGSLKDYHEIHQSFHIWARSLAGRFGTERSVDEERLYGDLVRLLLQKGISPQRELHISVVYDRFPLGNLEVSPYFTIISIEEFLGQYEDVVARLGNSIH